MPPIEPSPPICLSPSKVEDVPDDPTHNPNITLPRQAKSSTSILETQGAEIIGGRCLVINIPHPPVPVLYAHIVAGPTSEDMVMNSTMYLSVFN